MTPNSKNKLRAIFSFFMIICIVGTVCWEWEPYKQDYYSHTLKTLATKKKVDPSKKEGPALFAEYHHHIRTKKGQLEPAYKLGYRIKEFRKSIERRHQLTLSRESLVWIERGPANVGGRTRSIWVDPTDPTHLSWFVGSAGGGVWKTENGGENWRHLTDELTNLSTSTLGGSLADPNILYAGTGEGYFSRSIVGNGIWKSTDAGESWFPLDIPLNNPKFGHIMRIAVSQSDPNKIVVATRLGRFRDLPSDAPRSFIFKSTDGGMNWEQKWEDKFIIQQIIAHPFSFNTLFASANSGGILRSVDAGESWHMVYDVQNTNIGRMEIAISPTNPAYVYVSAYALGKSLLYLSKDQGETWTEIKGKDVQNNFGSWMANQGWYDNAIGVHPFDPNTVFVGGQGAILKITVLDESQAFQDGTLAGLMEPITDGYSQYDDRFNTSSKGVHVDHHGLVLIPIDENRDEYYILNANDGGIAFSKDGGETFTQTGTLFSRNGAFSSFSGYNTSQFYGVDKMNGADRYVGGTQDNGSWVSGIAPNATSIWRSAPSGDGFEAAWNYEDPNKILESSQFNNIYRSDDGGVNWRNVSPPGNGPFITRIANSKIDPYLVFCVTNQGIVRSLDFADTWEIIDMPADWVFGSSINVCASLASHLYVWTGGGMTEDNRIFVSQDAGSSFSKTNFYEYADTGPISGLATHPFNEKTAYVLFSAADGPKVLRTTDLGNNWEDISGFVTNAPESTNGFPDVAVYSLLVMPFDTNQIWVGTEIGLYESLDGGKNWHYADNGLPPASIWEMKIVNDEVILATHGRGIWTVSLPELEGYEPPEATALIPLLTLNENGLGGRIDGSYQLRSDYDSVFIEIDITNGNQQLIFHQLPVDSIFVGERDLNIKINGLPKDTILQANVTLLGFKNGQALSNTRQTPVFGIDPISRNSYMTDFDSDSSHFAQLDFRIYQPSNFENKALHSRHPYLGYYQTYLAVLNFPIVVSSTFSKISFDEIAMIEAGEEGTVFGDFEFWDYVAVEGSKDLGNTWEVIEGYDSRWSDRWVGNFQPNSPTVDPSLVETHTMDLASVFSPGDTIFLRFRLQSDPLVEGWGWMIDNLNIQQDPTNIDLERKTFSLNVLPNPSRDIIHLHYSLHKAQKVKIDVYTITGQYLATLQNNLKSLGKHEEVFDIKDLKSGMYFFQIEMDGIITVVKWMKY